MTWLEYARAWSALHGGFDPVTATPLVRGWVQLAYRGGSVLARLGFTPTVVTAAGLLLCLLVPVVAAFGPAGLVVASFVVLAAGFADSFDGAVAVITGRSSRAGFVVDSVADRVGEAAWLVAFWLAGAPGWLVVAAGAVSWLHEYVRARAIAAGMPDIGAVTVGERPTRVSVAISGLLVGGVAGLVRDGWDVAVVTVAAVAWLALAVIGLGQLAAVVRRALRT
ncbi:MAG TPA: CDP-alcohol phosphatidyltransferase family protein [Actinoplanes sp.]|nr:CDP-alcohol phosphatidyltransferase family protein [Actinoplanes sp.]